MTKNFPPFEFYCVQTIFYSKLIWLTYILSFANFSDLVFLFAKRFYSLCTFLKIGPDWKFGEHFATIKICTWSPLQRPFQ